MPDTLNDRAKAQQLRKHKAIATGLFILMALVYVICTWLLKTREDMGLGYLKAFAEAAMVGALADWFAVTALFHHPLGIPIPHTNLIENKKKNIGDNLGDFVVTNFLNTTTIRPYINKMQVSHWMVQWLDNTHNKNLLATEISKILKDVVKNADAGSITRFLEQQSQKLLKEIRLNQALASGLDIIMERGDQMRILSYLVTGLRSYVTENETLVHERVKKESHFLIPGFVDNLIATKITKGLVNYLSEIEQDAGHKVRKEINEHLISFIADIRSNPYWEQELEDIKSNLLSGDKIHQYAAAAWQHLQVAIITDLDSNESAIRLYLQKTLGEMTGNLKNDPALQQKINKWVQTTAYKYIIRNTARVGELISSTVGNWQGKELSNKLELEVGKDLQFIRINGTLVGGLVGLLIYTVTRLIENS